MQRIIVSVLSAALFAASLSSTSTAEAQVPDPVQVEAGVKGTIGLGIIGAEIGFAIPALARMDGAWPYIVFPVIGAGAGAALGYFLIDNKDNEKAAVAVLATGVALIVPTFILTVARTAYRPVDDVEEVDGEAEYLEETAEEVAARRRARIARSGTGALRFSEDGVLLTVPGLTLTASLTREESFRYGGAPQPQVGFSLVSGVF